MEVELNELKFWYSKEGKGEALVMLHPGGVGVDSRAFDGNVKTLARYFTVYRPERRGHGRTADSPGAYSYELMADDTIAFIEQVVTGSPVKLLGMSDGAVVALLVASKRPDLVERLICVAGVFNNKAWWETIQPIAPEALPDFLIDSYAAISPDGKEHFPVIHKKLTDMHLNGPTLSVEDLKSIRMRTLVMTADDDEMTLEHSIEFYRSLPQGELAIIPGTSHGLMIEKPALCEKIILDFLQNDPVETLAPVMRK